MGCQSIAGYPPTFRQVFLTVRRYPFILLGGEKHCETEVSCPRTQHNDPARDQTRTLESSVLTTKPPRLPINHINNNCTCLLISVNQNSVSRQCRHTQFMFYVSEYFLSVIFLVTALSLSTACTTFQFRLSLAWLRYRLARF